MNKKGKFIQLGYYNNIKIGYGTVDYVDLKSIYLTLNSWVEPKNINDFLKEITKNKHKIRTYLSKLNNNRFKNVSIVDFDLRTKGIKINKRSYMDLEITLFVNEQFNLKNKNVKNEINGLLKDIIDNILNQSDYFLFNKTKI